MKPLVGSAYTRGQLELAFGLGPRSAMAAAGKRIVLVLKRDNSQGYWNSFEGRSLRMEGNPSAAEENERLRKSNGQEVLLFWSEAGGRYEHLGRIELERYEAPGRNPRPIFWFRLLDDAANPPAA